ncbi:hypothetical protein ANRL1_04897, partial [Anaerolineae bacterium]
HPANIYTGIQSDQYISEAGEPIALDFIAVAPDSQPIANKPLDLTLVELRWERVPKGNQFARYEWEQTEIEVETAQVTTGTDGQTQYTFTPPNAGIFRVRAAATDEQGRRNSSTFRFYVTGGSEPVWWRPSGDRIEMTADKSKYQPGDTAQILIPLPTQDHASVLISVERAGIMLTDVVEVEGSTLIYDLPITEAYAPTIHFDVTVVYGPNETNRNPGYAYGKIALQIEPTQYRLNVTVTPSATQAQPRAQVAFDIYTTDITGRPVSAEVGVKLTDKAILDLLPPNSRSLETVFYGPQWIYVSTTQALSGLLDRLVHELESPQPGGMGGGAGPIRPSLPIVRANFEQTPLWEPHVVTDDNGHATVSLELPDNLTTWELDARAVTSDTRVGQTTTEIISTLPLIVRPVTPRFFVVGDHVQLAAVVNNNTNEPQTVEATLQAKGVLLENSVTQTVTIAANSRARVEWWAVAQDVTSVDLTFVALGENGFSDAAKPMLATGPDNTIPVYRYTAPDTTGTAGILRDGGSLTEGISLPPRLVDTQQGSLVIRIDPSLAVASIDALDYLKNYPHQCIEQTVSRFLPNVVTYRALLELGIEDPTLEANLVTVLAQAHAKLLKEQLPDGGWGWFYRMEHDPLVTAYATLGLIEAQASGFEVDQAMLDKAIAAIEHDLYHFGANSVNTPTWQFNRQAFYLYVLAKADQARLEQLNTLYAQRVRMSYEGRAYLLLAYLENSPAAPAVANLAADLRSAAILSATGVHWEEAEPDWWNWSSDTRTTALILTALTQAAPTSDLLAGAVRWLMVARQGDHWETTQETVWATVALTNWMRLTGELEGNYDYAVSLNGEELVENSVTPSTVREGRTLRVAVGDLLLNDLNPMVVARTDGAGVLYYTAHLDLRLFASDVEATSRGITVTREYFLADDPETPVTTAKVGDILNVRVTFTLTNDIYYFVLEDPLPAGTEGINT